MNVQIIEQKEEPLHVAIYCSHTNHTILNLKSHIELFDMRLQAKKSGETRFVNPSDILYFESVDNRTFLYTREDVLELKQRLYELEETVLLPLLLSLSLLQNWFYWFCLSSKTGKPDAFSSNSARNSFRPGTKAFS